MASFLPTLPLTLTLSHAFAVLGLLSTLPTLLRLARSIHLYFFHRSTLSLYTRPHAYVLITGATDGIGLGHARVLATHNFNLILHGRNASKLSKIKTELLSKHPHLSIRLLVIDATNGQNLNPLIEMAVKELQDLDGPLTMLVNNAGGTGPQHDGFATLQDLSAEEVDGMINLNARLHAQLTRALMPLLIASRPSVITNISSVVATTPMPWLDIYAGCKAFGESFTQALARTCLAEGNGVSVHSWVVVKVMGTAHDHPGVAESLFEPGAERFARACLARLGCGWLSVAPYWPHALQVWGMGLMGEGRLTGVLKGVIEVEKRKIEERKKGH